MSEQETQTAAVVTAPALAAPQSAPVAVAIPVSPVTAPALGEAPKVKPVYVWGTGRRKTAVARVRIAAGSGKIEINGRTINDYFSAEQDRKAIFGPLEVTNTGGKMDVFINANGGGLSGQAGAILMGLGRALLKYDQAFEVALRNSGFLTRDSRMKERKKYGQRGARRRFQFSKR